MVDVDGPSHRAASAVTAWRRLLDKADAHPLLAGVVARQGADLFRRFTYFYNRLLSQPARLRWRWERKLRLGLAGAALLLALAGPTVRADPSNMIMVDEISCTLVDAITAANTDAAAGGCGAGSGADVIDLQTDVTLTAANNETYGATGLPVVTSEIIIQGNGHTMRSASGAGRFRIIAIGKEGTLALNNATVSGGRADVRTTELLEGRGGGVYNRGKLTLSECIISGNSARISGGGLLNSGSAQILNTTISDNTSSNGGGVQNQQGTTRISHSMISQNRTDSDGGGIGVQEGSLTIEDSAIHDNRAGFFGGGLFVFNGMVSIQDSAISGNSGVSSSSSIRGGGIHIRNGTLLVNNSTLSDNVSAQAGGAIYNHIGKVSILNSTIFSNSSGSGTFTNWGGKAYIVNSTFSANNATFSGGGIDNSRSGLYVVNSTITENHAKYGGGVANKYGGDINLRNTVISGNLAQDSGSEIFNRSSNINSAFGLLGHAGETRAQAFSGFTPNSTDTVATSDGTRPATLTGILVTTLAENNGPTPTHALASGSPAMDAAPSDSCIAGPVNGLDQRGLPRNVNGDGRPSANECDIGAYELQAAPTPPEIPEPATLLLLGTGLAGLAAYVRRRSSRSPGRLSE